MGTLYVCAGSLGVLCLGQGLGWNVANASSASSAGGGADSVAAVPGAGVSATTRLVGDEQISKLAAQAFVFSPGSLFLVRGVDVTARHYYGRWSSHSSEELSMKALSAAAFVVVPWTTQFSNMIVAGASGFERGFSRVRPEGVVHTTYKSSDTLSYTAFLTWEAGTYVEYPFFIDFGVTYKPTPQLSLKAVIPAVFEARWKDLEIPVSYTAFFKTGRELAYSIDNEGRIPGANGVLEVGRRGWKLGAGASYRAFGGEIAAEAGALVFQKLKVESRGKTVDEGKFPSTPFVELSLKFPSFSFY
jgi:hypothetical protein